MSAHQARVRTESMVQRLSKKPIAEGFELWDKGYYLGAMRLFIFKAETSPPFQLGACLDAVGQLLARIDEGADAKENFGYAAEKYDLIQQPVLAQLMTVKGIEATEGAAPALEKLNALLTEADPKGEAEKEEDTKLRTALARAYHYKAELLMSIDPSANANEALKNVELALKIGWDREHLALYLAASIRQLLGDVSGAVAGLEKCIERNGNYLLAYEALVPLLQEQKQSDKVISLLDKAIALHPKSALIRQKAFAMSDSGNESGAVNMLQEYIQNPPHEETEALVALPGQATATFLKAIAAIYADSGKMAEALNAAQDALKHQPNDEETQQLIADIQSAQ